MGTITRQIPDPSDPQSAGHPDGGWASLYAKDPSGVTYILRRSDVAKAAPENPHDHVRSLGWRPMLETFKAHQDQDLYDWTCRTHENVWRYWITTPKTLVKGVRRFVAAAEAGGLPSDWKEKAAEDAGKVEYVICSFRLSMDGARSLGAEQQALGSLATLPESIYFFQRVASIDGFTGIKKESRQPDQLNAQLYEPGHLFQTNHPDGADVRKSSLSKSDVLEMSDLTLI